MKSLICFCTLILLIGFAAPAHAYRINVLDPPAGYPVTTEPFNVVFTPCPTNAANGCFYGVNETGHTLTTLEIIFPNSGPLQGQTPVCSKNSVSLFQTGQCQVINGYQVFFFDFTGNLPILDDQPFLIQEEGITFTTNSDGQTNFPTGTSYSPPTLVIPNAVPEPNSVVLLSTGLLLGGFFFAKKRDLISASVAARFDSR